MQVYNLTDVETPALKARGLVNQQIVVGTELAAPGAGVEVGDTPHLRAQLEDFVSIGALALDTLPASYVAAKASTPVNVAANVASPSTNVDASLVEDRPKKDRDKDKKDRGSREE